MIARESACRLLEDRGLSARLVAHCKGVAETARDLGEHWCGDGRSAELAGLLHDLCRELGRQEVLRRARMLGLRVSVLEERYPVQLLHGPLAAAELVSSGLPEASLRAISRHTVGGAGMTAIERCVFVADAIEPGRAYPGVAGVRLLAGKSLDQAARAIVARDIDRLRSRGREVHPAMVAFWRELGGQ
jgi:predicted HD superfamily hydrolase involved in NAD metabolism